MALLPLGLAPKTIKYLMFAFNLLFVACNVTSKLRDRFRCGDLEDESDR